MTTIAFIEKSDKIQWLAFVPVTENLFTPPTEYLKLTSKPPLETVCHCDMTLDIDLASGVQQLLFPRSSPVCNWCCVGVKNRMAQGLGGDYFDFIQMPDGCQTLFIGDVTGHGLHASIVMSLIYGFIHRSSLDKCDPLDVITGVNRFLRHFATRSQELDYLFSTTLFLAIIDPKSFRMHYINCGHVRPLIRRGQQLFRLETTAPPLGFFEDPEIELGTFEFAVEDRLLLYTDGVSEATNANNEQFGRARIEAALLEIDDDHMEFLDALYQRTVDFGCSQPPIDDCTTIILDFHKPLPGALN
ncbi:MAG: serine/threonine-protein phosphatase [Geopsychrobacter sp.]|nr:serine/threonine-protein phosphatase [Geopsychrobacter sp.]